MSLINKNEFYLYLSSGDVNAYSAANTSMKFRVPFATPFVLPREQNWCVGLSQISYPNSLRTTTIVSPFVKVYSSIIQPRYNQEKILAIIPRNTAEKDFQHFEVSKPEYFPLGTSHVSGIDIELSDIDGGVLSNTISQPTILVLKFKKMTTEEFVVRFDSQQDTKGKASDFMGQLPTSLLQDPNQKWEVSLNSFLYKGNFANIPPIFGERVPLRVISTCFKIAQADEEEMSHDYEGDFVQTEVPCEEKAYLQGNKMNNNMMVFSKFKAAMDTFIFHVDKTTKERYFKYLRMHEDVIRFEVNKDCLLKIPYSWAAVMGTTDPPDEEGNVNIQLVKGQTYKFPNKVDFTTWIPRYILLYCDFIDHSPFGSYYVPVLKTIPLKSVTKTSFINQFYEPKTDEFHPVTFSQMQNVKFQLRTIDGRPAQFNYDSARVLLTLKFRKR